ncbi:hypothetical protein EUTSA_v10003306mg [Eutrema salsugineum]|uniref:Uncharacterized protein n=1 Tax=Eutrema salsugineum TaxID=72664 RepID=V4LM20_EUTSA|nr:hypothetical protein EUTSA_v10003306mg [Eutrema salsugineum]
MMTMVNRAELERLDGTGDFSLWTIWRMAHLGVSGLHEVVLNYNFENEVPVTKKEGKKQSTKKTNQSEPR